MSAEGGRQYFGFKQKRDEADVHDPVVVLHGTHISAADDDLAEKVSCLLQWQRFSLRLLLAVHAERTLYVELPRARIHDKVDLMVPVLALIAGCRL